MTPNPGPSPLEEEREFLLRSIKDLDREFAAGDIDEVDYHELRNDYTVRAADVIRSLDSKKPVAKKAVGRSKGKLAAIVAGVVLFAVGAGYLLAQASGERGADEALTGNLDESLRDKVLECEQLGFAQQTLEALQCFDVVLDEDPQNAEALTYRGWFLALAARNAESIGEQDNAVELFASALASLTSAIEIEPNYPDARALRGVQYSWLGEEELACADFSVLDDLDTPDMITGLTSSVRAELGCEAP